MGGIYLGFRLKSGKKGTKGTKETHESQRLLEATRTSWSSSSSSLWTLSWLLLRRSFSDYEVLRNDKMLDL